MSVAPVTVKRFQRTDEPKYEPEWWVDDTEEELSAPFGELIFSEKVNFRITISVPFPDGSVRPFAYCNTETGERSTNSVVHELFNWELPMGIAGWCANEKETYFIPNLKSPDTKYLGRFVRSAADVEDGGIIAAPLLDFSRQRYCIAVLSVTCTFPNFFTEEHKRDVEDCAAWISGFLLGYDGQTRHGRYNHLDHLIEQMPLRKESEQEHKLPESLELDASRTQRLEDNLTKNESLVYEDHAFLTETGGAVYEKAREDVVQWLQEFSAAERQKYLMELVKVNDELGGDTVALISGLSQLLDDEEKAILLAQMSGNETGGVDPQYVQSSLVRLDEQIDAEHEGKKGRKPNTIKKIRQIWEGRWNEAVSLTEIEEYFTKSSDKINSADETEREKAWARIRARAADAIGSANRSFLPSLNVYLHGQRTVDETFYYFGTPPPHRVADL